MICKNKEKLVCNYYYCERLSSITPSSKYEYKTERNIKCFIHNTCCCEGVVKWTMVQVGVAHLMSLSVIVIPRVRPNSYTYKPRHIKDAFCFPRETRK